MTTMIRQQQTTKTNKDNKNKIQKVTIEMTRQRIMQKNSNLCDKSEKNKL